MFDVTKSVSIRDILTLSVIISFSTSSQGWISTANGELLIKSNEEPDDRHVTLVEWYDFEKDLQDMQKFMGRYTNCHTKF